MNAPKSVLVTGSSTGIGRATAVHLAEKGFRVFAGVRKDGDAESIRTENSGITPVRIDVVDRGSIVACREAIDRASPEGLAGLVNNAGVSVFGPMEHIPLDELGRQLEVNVIGQVAVTQAFASRVRATRGRIVFIGSVAGRTPSLPFFGPYTASKWALEAIVDAFRLELRPWGIRVSLIEPGAIDTAIWSKGYSAFEDVVAWSSEETRPVYEPLMRKGLRLTRMLEGRGRPATVVARRVEHALTSPRPRTRYLVGPDAKARAWSEWLLPDKIRDRAVATALSSKRL